MLIVLDSGPLFMVNNSQANENTKACQEWLKRMVAQGATIVVPEIADYEIRRFMHKGDRYESIAALDALNTAAYYLPLTTAVMRKAAKLWAESRKKHFTTGHDLELDADVILAAQALTLDENTQDEVIVASDNIRHLKFFVNAQRWQDIMG